MPHLVTSHQGEDHVESYNDRHYNAGHIGNDSYAFKGRGNFACSMVDSNTLRIMSGDAQCCGAHWSIDSDYEEYTIETGTPGYKRTDLVVAHIETAPQETMDIRVLKGEETTGTPVTPSYIEGDLNAGDTVVEMPLCSVELNGINPGQPNMLLDFLVPYKEFCDSLLQDGRQSDQGRVDCPANNTRESEVISFPKAYRYPPLVSVSLAFDGLMTPETAKDMEFTPFSITETGFRVKVRNGGAFAHAGKFDWQAYGVLAVQGKQ